jgi:putative oxidoreductase
MHPYLKTARRWYRIEIRILDRVRDVLFLVLRLYFGYKLILSGKGKLANPDETAAYFRDLHIPLPELNAFAAGATELFGGLFLALGLLSRLSTIPVIGVMLVAYMTAHEDQWAAFWTNTAIFFKAPPFAYLFTAAMVLVCGPGRLSLDYVLGRFIGPDDAAPTDARDDASW